MAGSQEPASRGAWNGLAAVIAALVGFLALLVSAYTAYIQRQQTRAQVWPRLETGVTPAQRVYSIRNKGIGPAIVRGVQVYVDGKAQPDWNHVYTALGVKLDKPPPASTISARVISPGEEIAILHFDTDADFAAVIRSPKMDGLRLCYCSVLDDCWLLDERTQQSARQTQPVTACPVDPAAEFTQ